ncbi:MAG: alpha/beta fold hydrolase [Armatimonadota bacterium]
MKINRRTWLGGAAALGMAAFGAPSLAAEERNEIEFGKVDGESLTLDAYVPEGKGPFPTAILVHGGGFINGTKRSYITPIFEPLSRAGFAWFTINYRLAPQHRYPACVEDVERAVRWVKQHAAEYHADPRRIALIGESAGGHLVSMVGARGRGETAVAAVVPFYAPHDLEYQAREKGGLGRSLSALFGLTELDDAARKTLRDGSPSSYVRKGMPPYLLIHGTEDEQVPYAQSTRFQEQMKAAGNTCDLYTIPNGRHGMGGWDSFHPQYKQAMTDWLRRTLG